MISNVRRVREMDKCKHRIINDVCTQRVCVPPQGMGYVRPRGAD